MFVINPLDTEPSAFIARLLPNANAVSLLHPHSKLTLSTIGFEAPEFKRTLMPYVKSNRSKRIELGLFVLKVPLEPLTLGVEVPAL